MGFDTTDYLFDLRGYALLRNAVEPELVRDLNKSLDDFPELPFLGWGATRHGFHYSQELIDRLTPERRIILQPIPPRLPGSGFGILH